MQILLLFLEHSWKKRKTNDQERLPRHNSCKWRPPEPCRVIVLDLKVGWRKKKGASHLWRKKPHDGHSQTTYYLHLLTARSYHVSTFKNKEPPATSWIIVFNTKTRDWVTREFLSIASGVYNQNKGPSGVYKLLLTWSHKNVCAWWPQLLFGWLQQS